MSTTAEVVVDEYRRHLEELYEQVRKWLDEAGLVCEEQNMSIHEERSGQYQAPELRILNGNKLLVELIPIGADIIGAEGRVDLRGHLDTRPILYLLPDGPVLHTSISIGSEEVLEKQNRPLFKGIDHEGWYALADRDPKSVRTLDREIFFALLKQVADYGERE